MQDADDVSFVGARVEGLAHTTLSANAMGLFEICALMRSCQIAGALASALEISVAYCNVREQFGRKIGAFQAVQQELAKFAGMTAAALCSSQAACLALDGSGTLLDVAAAKLSANKAAAVATMIAHQVHGAIGFTQEYRLHAFTRRAWAWRAEFGNDSHWARRLGEHVRAQPAESLWATITGGANAVQQ